MVKQKKTKNKQGKKTENDPPINELRSDENLTSEVFADIFSENSNIEQSEVDEEIEKIQREFLRGEKDSFFGMDNSFQDFLDNFIQNQNEKEKQKIQFKQTFFDMIMLIFFILFLTPMGIVYSFREQLTEPGIITAVIAALIELVAAIIVLPQIIAEYLFNKEEDKHVLDIIEKMQDYNAKKHTHITNSKKESP